jgi:hypothetical protein
MPTDRLDMLRALADRIAERPRWQMFAQYCRLRAEGMRVEALVTIRSFVAIAETWALEDRVALCLWLADHHREAGNLIVPQPLLVGLVVPTARQWAQVAPDAADAHFLLGLFGDMAALDDGPAPLDCFRRAIALDPAHQPALRELVDRVTAWNEYAQHELPWGYLGTSPITEDIDDLREAAALLPAIADHEWVEGLAARLEELLATAIAWQAFRAAKAEDFPRWCLDHGTDNRFAAQARQSPDAA